MKYQWGKREGDKRRLNDARTQIERAYDIDENRERKVGRLMKGIFGTSVSPQPNQAEYSVK